MKRILLLACTILICTISCQTAEKQPSDHEPEVLVSVKYWQSPEKRRLARARALKAEVVAAVKYALSLEKRLFNHGSVFKSKEQVYKHYRQGFGVKMAKKLTEYSWANGEMDLRPGDPTMEPPKKVEVSQIDVHEAIVFYKTPKWLCEIWGTEKFTLVKLKKEKGRWVIVEAKGADSPPSY